MSLLKPIKTLWLPPLKGQVFHLDAELDRRRLQWLELEKEAGIYGKYVKGMLRTVSRPRSSRSSPAPRLFPLGLAGGQWIGMAVDSKNDLVVILRGLSDKMKTLATEQKVRTFPHDFLTQIYEGFEFLGKVGTEAVILLAQCGCGDEDNTSAKDLVQFVKSWEKLYCQNRITAGEFAAVPSLEEAALAANLSYARLSGALAESAMLYGSNMVRVILHTSMPKVVRAIIDDAIEPETRTMKDKELAAKVGGLIESGAKVQINNQMVQNTSNGSQLPAYVNAQELLQFPNLLPRKELPEGPEGVDFVEGEIMEPVNVKMLEVMQAAPGEESAN